MVEEQETQQLSEAQQAKAAKNRAKIARMGTDPMFKLIVAYSLPAIAGLLVTSLYGLVDGIFIGIGVGDAGIAATTVAMPFMVVTMAINTLIGNGGNIVASIRLGEGRPEEAEKSLGNTIALIAIVWIALMAICIPLIGPIARLSGATDASYDYAVTYMIIMIIGFLFNGLSGGIGNYIRTAGAPNVVMAFMMISGVANIVFDYFAVLVFGWGIAGAGWATVLSMAIAGILTIIFFTRKTTSIQLRAKYFKLEGYMVKDIFKLGLAGFFMNALMAITGVIINHLFIHYGDQEVITGTGAPAAYGAAGRVQSIFFQVIIGISMAAQPIMGYNFGAHYFARLKKCFWVSANLGFVSMLVATVVALIIPEPILALFALQDETLGFAVFVMRSMMVLIPIAAYGIIGSTYFMATGQAAKANILVLLRQIFLLVPFLYLCPLFLPPLFGITPTGSIVWAFPIVDIFATTITMVLVLMDLKKLSRRIAEGDTRDDPATLLPLGFESDTDEVEPAADDEAGAADTSYPGPGELGAPEPVEASIPVRGESEEPVRAESTELPVQ